MCCRVYAANDSEEVLKTSIPGGRADASDPSDSPTPGTHREEKRRPQLLPTGPQAGRGAQSHSFPSAPPLISDPGRECEGPGPAAEPAAAPHGEEGVRVGIVELGRLCLAFLYARGHLGKVAQSGASQREEVEGLCSGCRDLSPVAS